jgi:hypothetical protein
MIDPDQATPPPAEERLSGPVWLRLASALAALAAGIAALVIVIDLARSALS